MKAKTFVLILVAVLALALLVVFARVVVTFVQGAANFALGALVLLALLAIVLWMFAYAKKAGKK